MMPTFANAFHRFANSRQQYGTWPTVQWLVARASKKLLRLEISEVVWLELANLSPSLVPDAECEFRFLSPAEVEQFAGDPVNQLAAEFVARAKSGRDFCFAALHNGRLANYGWYALGSVEGAHNVGVAMSYPADVAYMYNGFTHPDYRGRRLHGAAMALALRGLAELGVTKLVSTVESTNFASLRSCYRLGYRSIGRLWTFGRGNSRPCLAPQAARELGVRFGRRAEVLER